MELENNNMPDNNQYGRDVSNIYPNPVEPKFSSTPEKLQPPLPINESHKIPWIKIALLGFLTQINLGLYWVFLLASGFMVMLTLAAIFRGLENLFFVFHLIAILITYKFLKHWHVKSPLIIASASLIFLFGIYNFLKKIPISSSFDAYLAGYAETPLERSGPLIVYLIYILSGVFIFLLATYLTNKFKFKRTGISLLLLVVVGLYMGAITYESPPTLVSRLPKVKDASWKILPTYLPPGVVDKGKNNANNCAEERTSSAWYECDYKFMNYPGYLSSESQTIINRILAEDKTPKPGYYYHPSPLFNVKVIRDDRLLDPYKYEENKCDVLSLDTVGTSPRNRDGSVVAGRNASLQRCATVISPAGKNLYYDSYLNYYTEKYEKVPVNFYFEQAGNVVIINVGNGMPFKGTVGALYHTDANFQPEFFKFVDSFK